MGMEIFNGEAHENRLANMITTCQFVSTEWGRIFIEVPD
jgi:hypothetical protein